MPLQHLQPRNEALDQSHLKVSLKLYSESKESYQTALEWIRGQEIGRGAYGRVYEGMNNNDGKRIAIKSVYVTKSEWYTKKSKQQALK